MPIRRPRAVLASLLAMVGGAAALLPAQAAPVTPSRPRPLIMKLSNGPLAAMRDSTGVPFPVGELGPGSQLVMERPDGSFLCTAGFVFQSGGSYFLGAAGHCFLPENTSATVGTNHYDASRTTVYACATRCAFGGQSGGSLNQLVRLGAVRYARQNDGNADIGHDFGLVQIPNGMTFRAGLPVWNGPRRETTSVRFGEPVCVFGAGTGVGETFATMARNGVATFANDTTWGAELPSAIGDSGAGVVTCAASSGGVEGIAAVGILTHTVVSASIIQGTTVAQARRLAREAGLEISLVTG